MLSLDERIMMHELCPTLMNACNNLRTSYSLLFIVQLDKGGERIPIWARRLLSDLAAHHLRFLGAAQDLHLDHERLGDARSFQSVSITEGSFRTEFIHLDSIIDLAVGACYNSYLRWRRRETHYSLDSVVARSRLDDREREPTCTKTAPSHATLAPGLLCFTCPHNIILGIEFLRSQESPKHPFQVLLNRFRRGILSV